MFAPATIDPVAVALEVQGHRLQRLAYRLLETTSGLPRPEDGIWRGPAHAIYSAALQGLADELSAAQARLGAAAIESGRAAAALVAGA